MFGNVVLDENYFSHLFRFLRIGRRFDSHLPKFGIHRSRLRNYDERSVMPPHSLMFHQKSTVAAKMDHLGCFRPSTLVKMSYPTVGVRFLRKIFSCSGFPHDGRCKRIWARTFPFAIFSGTSLAHWKSDPGAPYIFHKSFG